jgi:hypothetical protein
MTRTKKIHHTIFQFCPLISFRVFFLMLFWLTTNNLGQTLAWTLQQSLLIQTHFRMKEAFSIHCISCHHPFLQDELIKGVCYSCVVYFIYGKKDLKDFSLQYCVLWLWTT